MRILAQDKRVIQGYEVKHVVQLAGAEVILAENMAADEPFMVCDCEWNNDLGFESYHNGLASSDFIEIMREFARRISERTETLEAERTRRGIPLEVLTVTDCVPKSMSADLNGKVVVIKPEKLSPEYRSADYQLALCTGGFGANPDSRGRTVYCTEIYSGEHTKWRRDNIAGVIKPERMPEWAREKLAALQKPAERESAVETSAPLDKGQFWRLIDEARETAGSWQGMLEPLVESLARLEETDIIRFKQIYNEYQDLAYKDKLWAAAAVMHGGCSDDGFIDFRGWLIAQGKEVYLSALADPDSLADNAAVQAFASEVQGSEYVPSNGYHEAASFEAMAYAAGDAYTKKLGNDADIYGVLDNPLLSNQEKAVIAAEITYAADIDAKWGGLGKPWPETEAALKKMLPKLHRAFSGEEAPAQQRTAEKESVLGKIRDSNKQPNSRKPKQKNHDKGGPEL